MPEFSKLRDCECNVMCDTLGVTNRYRGYRHNLNRGTLDPVTLGCAWLNETPPYPKWTPEPKWVPPHQRVLQASKFSPAVNCCNDWSSSMSKVEAEMKRLCCISPAEDNSNNCATTVRFRLPKAEPTTGQPCNRNETCDTQPNIQLPVPVPPRPNSQPSCEPQATQSFSVTKCVPVPRSRSAEKGCCNTTPYFTPLVVCGNPGLEVDLSQYIRPPRRECYVKNGGGRKADHPGFIPQKQLQNCFMPQPPLRKPGCNSATVRVVNPRPTHGTVPNLHVRHSGVTMTRGPRTATIQERCGINTVFPGKTEYQERYQRPAGPTKTTPFKINPTLDFSVYGRPLDKHGHITKVTEYQSRYEWPDGSKISPLPWIRASKENSDPVLCM